MTRNSRSHVRILIYQTWAIYFVIVTGDLLQGACQLLAKVFPLSLVTVPEVFASVNSVQFPLVSKVVNDGRLHPKLC